MPLPGEQMLPPSVVFVVEPPVAAHNPDGFYFTEKKKKNAKTSIHLHGNNKTDKQTKKGNVVCAISILFFPIHSLSLP